MTFSEKLFEQYCRKTGITCTRIPERREKTPDYEVRVDNQLIIVEVKEIHRSKEESESDRVLALRGYGNVLSCTPGDRIRQKIDDCSAQIKARTRNTFPSVLVLFDHGLRFGHLDPYAVRAAMYGLEQLHIALPPLGVEPHQNPYVTGSTFGPKRRMTPSEKKAISALGVLHTPEAGEVALCVYHNKFATIPLDRNLAARLASEQYELESEALGQVPRWNAT
jgi:hypothetical protein